MEPTTLDTMVLLSEFAVSFGAFLMLVSTSILFYYSIFLACHAAGKDSASPLDNDTMPMWPVYVLISGVIVGGALYSVPTPDLILCMAGV